MVGQLVCPFSYTLLWKLMVQKGKGTDNTEEGFCLNLVELDLIYNDLSSGDEMESSHDYHCAIFLIFE